MKVEIKEVGGNQYLVVGDRAFPILRFDEGRKPVVDMKGTWSEQKPNAQGGTDCIVHVPFLQVVPKLEPLSGEEE